MYICIYICIYILVDERRLYPHKKYQKIARLCPMMPGWWHPIWPGKLSVRRHLLEDEHTLQNKGWKQASALRECSCWWFTKGGWCWKTDHVSPCFTIKLGWSFYIVLFWKYERWNRRHGGSWIIRVGMEKNWYSKWTIFWSPEPARRLFWNQMVKIILICGPKTCSQSLPSGYQGSTMLK